MRTGRCLWSIRTARLCGGDDIRSRPTPILFLRASPFSAGVLGGFGVGHVTVDSRRTLCSTNVRVHAIHRQIVIRLNIF